MLGRMAFFNIAGLVHRRHDKKIHVRPSLSRDGANVGIEHTMLENLRVDLAIFPGWCFGGSMKPLQVILIDGIFDHLKIIAVDDARAHGALAVGARQDIVAR